MGISLTPQTLQSSEKCDGSSAGPTTEPLTWASSWNPTDPKTDPTHPRGLLNVFLRLLGQRAWAMAKPFTFSRSFLDTIQLVFRREDHYEKTYLALALLGTICNMGNKPDGASYSFQALISRAFDWLRNRLSDDAKAGSKRAQFMRCRCKEIQADRQPHGNSRCISCSAALRHRGACQRGHPL